MDLGTDIEESDGRPLQLAIVAQRYPNSRQTPALVDDWPRLATLHETQPLQRYGPV